MVYIVERYLAGVSSADIERLLRPLARVAAELRGEGVPVRYVDSVIVVEDESVLCRFDGPSEPAVRELNRRAGVAFDRIVPAIVVSPTVLEERETGCT